MCSSGRRRSRSPRARRAGALPDARGRVHRVDRDRGPRQLLEGVQRHRATVTVTSPTAYRAMLEQAGAFDLSSLRAASRPARRSTRPCSPRGNATGIRLMDGIRLDRAAARLHRLHGRGGAARIHWTCRARLPAAILDDGAPRRHPARSAAWPCRDRSAAAISTTSRTSGGACSRDGTSPAMRSRWTRTATSGISRAPTSMIVSSGYNISGAKWKTCCSRDRRWPTAPSSACRTPRAARS